MTVATFDTLKFANTLKAAGVPDKQAEAQATAFAEILLVNFKDLATKADIDRLATDIDRLAAAVKADLDEVARVAKADLDQAVKELRQEIKTARRETRELGDELKRELKELREELKRELKELRDEFKRDIKDAREESKREIKDEAQKAQLRFEKLDGQILLLRWMIGTTFAGVMVTLGLLVRLSFFRTP